MKYRNKSEGNHKKRERQSNNSPINQYFFLAEEKRVETGFSFAVYLMWRAAIFLSEVQAG
jgi:hypothetical protein